MKLSNLLAEIFFPRHCFGCGIPVKSGVVCRACFFGIPLNTGFSCGICRTPLPIAMKICHPNAPCLIAGAGPYANPALKGLIHGLKFRNGREAAEPLAELLATFIMRALPGAGKYIIVPIPLSRQRQLERGYNQAIEIATLLAGKISSPLAIDILSKVAHTKPQVTTADLQERQENLAGCFAVNRPAAAAGKKILLIDDVTTSGATFLEASKTLRAAGAGRIIAIATAKA